MVFKPLYDRISTKYGRYMFVFRRGPGLGPISGDVYKLICLKEGRYRYDGYTRY